MGRQLALSIFAGLHEARGGFHELPLCLVLATGNPDGPPVPLQELSLGIDIVVLQRRHSLMEE